MFGAASYHERIALAAELDRANNHQRVCDGDAFEGKRRILAIINLLTRLVPWHVRCLRSGDAGKAQFFLRPVDAEDCPWGAGIDRGGQWMTVERHRKLNMTSHWRDGDNRQRMVGPMHDVALAMIG